MSLLGMLFHYQNIPDVDALKHLSWDQNRPGLPGVLPCYTHALTLADSVQVEQTQLKGRGRKSHLMIITNAVLPEFYHVSMNLQT